MMDVIGVASKFGHFFKDFYYFKIVHPEPDQPLPKYFLKISSVALPKELKITRVLINLPGTKNILG